MSRGAFSLIVGGVVAFIAAGVPLAQAQPIQSVGITDIDAKLFFEAEFRDDQETRGVHQEKKTETDQLLRQGIEFDLDGYFYHPNFVDWNVDLRFGLTQQTTTLDDEELDRDGELLGYNLNAMLLKEKPVSMRLFATLDQNFVNRSFARNIDLNIRSEGAEIFFRGKVPVSVLFEHRVVDEISGIRQNEEESYSVRFTLEDRRDHDYLTRVTYEHEDTDQVTSFLSNLAGGSTVVQDLPDLRDELNFTNNWQFGEHDGLKHQLSGQGRFRRRRGFFNNDLYIVDQQLTLAHTETFSTFYRGSINSDDAEGQLDRTLRGEVGFIKQIYKSLRIVGRSYLSDRVLDNGGEEIMGGKIDLDYQKITPLGIFRSTVTTGLEFNDDHFDDATANVLDESVRLTGVSRAALDMPNVTTGSIRVTDISNAIIYEEGIDYIIQNIGPVTEISRLVGGSIVDGQEVFVDYNSIVGEQSEYRSETVTMNNRLNLDPWNAAIYANFRIRNEILTGGDDPENLDEEQTMLLGTEWTPGPWRIIAEYETRDHLLFPSWWAYRGRVNYIQVFDKTSINLGLEYENLQYLDPLAFEISLDRDFLKTYGAFMTIRTKVNRHLLLRFESNLYQTRGNSRNSLARIGGGAVWNYGRVEVSLDSYYDIWTLEQDDGTSLFVGFRLTRSF